MDSNGDLENVAKGDFSGLNSNNYWEAFTKDFSKLTGPKPKDWETTYTDLQSNSVHNPAASWAKVPDAAKEGKKGLFDRKYGGMPKGLDLDKKDGIGPKNEADSASDKSDFSIEVGDDYEKPKSKQELSQDKVNEGAELIGKARSFYRANTNAQLSKEDSDAITSALFDYTTDFNKKLPKSGFGNRDKRLGTKTTGFQKEYHEGVLKLMDDLTVDLDENTLEGWGQMSAIRRKLSNLSSSEDFALKVLGDDAGSIGSMDSSLEYIVTNRGPGFDWGFGSYHDDDKLLDHARIPKALRLELGTNKYVQEISDRVDHPNEVFDAKDKNKLLKTPVFALNPTDLARAMSFDLQDGSYYNKSVKEVRAGIEAKIYNRNSNTVVTKDGVEKVEIPTTNTTSLIPEDEVEVDVDADVYSSELEVEEVVMGDDPLKPKDEKKPATKDASGDPADPLAKEYEESLLDKMGGLSSLIGLATGAIGLSKAMKEVDIPKDPKLGPAFQQRLEESKRMAQQGLTPSELAKAHNDLDSSYSTGIENIVRGSAGNRAQFLAGLGGLDVARQSALMDISVADAKMRRDNQGTYDDMMMINEKHEVSRESKYKEAKYESDLANKSSASAMAGAGLTMLSESIGDRHLNQLRKMQTKKMMEDMGYTEPVKGKDESVDKEGLLNQATGLFQKLKERRKTKSGLIEKSSEITNNGDVGINLDSKNVLPIGNGIDNEDEAFNLQFPFGGFDLSGGKEKRSGLINPDNTLFEY